MCVRICDKTNSIDGIIHFYGILDLFFNILKTFHAKPLSGNQSLYLAL